MTPSLIFTLTPMNKIKVWRERACANDYSDHDCHTNLNTCLVAFNKHVIYLIFLNCFVFWQAFIATVIKALLAISSLTGKKHPAGRDFSHFFRADQVLDNNPVPNYKHYLNAKINPLFLVLIFETGLSEEEQLARFAASIFYIGYSGRVRAISRTHAKSLSVLPYICGQPKNGADNRRPNDRQHVLKAF